MRLITNKSKNLLYSISVEDNVTVQFGTSYAVATQRTADSASVNNFKIQGWDGTKHTALAGANIAIGKLTTTFTTPSTTGFKLIRFGLNGASIDTLCRCEMDLKPSTTYTFTCNFTNITQGSISWKDMMLVEGSTVGEYEPYSYNLLDKWQYPATQTVNGVTFTNNGDGTIVVDGTASDTIFYRLQTVKYTYGHIYLLWWTNNNSSSMKMETNDGEKQIYAYTGAIFTSKTNESNSVYIDVYPSSNPSSVITKPVLYDLTLMYGAGNEPTTVDQFYTDHPELEVSPLGFIELKNLEINNKNIKRLRYATTTRNLFDINGEIIQFNSVAVNGNSLVSDDISALATTHIKYSKVYSAGNYTISFGGVFGDCNAARVLSSIRPNTNWTYNTYYAMYYYDFPSGVSTVSFETTENFTIGFVLMGFGNYGGITNIQLEKGSTATSYVPYGYLDLGIIPSNSGVH